MTIAKPSRGRTPGTLPAFAPVPRKCARHDGWTAERQTGFIEALADTGSVRAAAHAVNMTPEGADQLRRQSGAASFRNAWEAALALGVQRLEDVAMDRALQGVEVPVSPPSRRKPAVIPRPSASFETPLRGSSGRTEATPPPSSAPR